MSGSDEAAASGSLPQTMTPAQCRAGRALIDWSVADLAAKVGFGEAAVRDFEAGLSELPSGSVEALRSALTTSGVAFTDEGAGGVRLSGQGGDDGTRLDQLTTENDR